MTVQKTVPGLSKTLFKLWWNQVLECIKEQSLTDHKLWTAAGKPCYGPIYSKYRSSKLSYA